MCLFSLEGLLLEGFPIVAYVLLEVVDSIFYLVSPGDEQTIDQVLSSGNVSLGVLDALLELDNHGVMFVCSLLEIKL